MSRRHTVDASRRRKETWCFVSVASSGSTTSASITMGKSLDRTRDGSVAIASTSMTSKEKQSRRLSKDVVTGTLLR
jgi:hypothetical protein